MDREDVPAALVKPGEHQQVVSRGKPIERRSEASLDLDPGLGSSWFSLANLKTVAFSDADIALMEQQLARSDLALGERVNLLYALGKAHEDAERTGEAFARYANA